MVSKEQRQKWKSSVSGLLSDPFGLQAFKDFLDNRKGADKTLHCLDFYENYEAHKNLNDEDQLRSSANSIYEVYLDDLAEKEIQDVGGNQSREISKRLDSNELSKDELKHLFDGAQENVCQFISDGVFYKTFCKELNVGSSSFCSLH
ncbi:unnamed protein product [Meganyctiphanes norvegica]|uniref:RGS domain-containing protein n=1 Tax=Meganyctiphanes norvegica TaxID=48144 RepID=A0AAV2RU64_MEGNR